MGYSKMTYENFKENETYWKEVGMSLPSWAEDIYVKGGDPVSAIDFYDDLFGEYLEEERMPEDYKTGEYAAIAIELAEREKDGKKQKYGRRVTVTRDQMELYDLIDESENFCMISPISYAGRSRTNQNARYLFALAMEIDNIKPKTGIDELFYSWERKTMPLPKPTYVVCSGNGVHLYFVFERPIPLFRNIFEQLSAVKKHFTPLFWNQFVTKTHERSQIQWESLNQPFRCVGTRGKQNCYAMAFLIGEKVTLEYINQFLPEDLQMNEIYKSKISREEAEERYPEWYKKVIVDGKKEKGHWNRHQPIYYNWIEKIKAGATVGKRYNCLENLCSLAVQCQIEPEQVEKDCREVAKRFEELTISEDNHFTEYDVLCALKTYHTASEKAYRRKIEFISKKTGITLTPNKRNKRSSKEHLQAETWKNEKGRPVVNDCKKNRELALQYMRDNGEISGRPSKAQIVEEWRAAHPDGRKADCIRETGLSKPTVYKWWNGEEAVRKKQPEKAKEDNIEIKFDTKEQEEAATKIAATILSMPEDEQRKVWEMLKKMEE